MDRLVWRAVASGCRAIIANSSRAEIDLNRDEREIDPATVVPSPPAGSVLPSARTKGGLGLIPSRIAGSGSIWLHRIGQDEVRRRVEEIHRPYHQAIAHSLQEARARFGIAILLDCHSMPPPARGVAPIVFGDRRGLSAAPWVSAEAVRIARTAGFAADLNDPFAGGHIVERHGAPERGIHALQVEIDRRAYLNERLDAPGPGFDAIATLIEALAVGLGDLLLSRQMATAAE